MVSLGISSDDDIDAMVRIDQVNDLIASWPKCDLPEELIRDIAVSQIALAGWCWPAKASWIAQAVLSIHASLCVEIGVYGGRSIAPMALAQRHLGIQGKVFAVDAWDNDIAVETPTTQENDKWWGTEDLTAVKDRFTSYLLREHLTDRIRIAEMASDDAARCFASPRFRNKVDLIHIDGSHSEEQAFKDVKAWAPLLRHGGLLVMDDIAWETLGPSIQLLNKIGDLVYEERSEPGSFAAFCIDQAKASAFCN
ncbi:class I SAM-dependent methyltransferase [Acidiphilium multivorum]|uniref:class I SAM-dependent methyltransferase n=1 Tax=Acidiphilium multivorum TaxID=62140 RepID=UPI0039C9AE9E